MIIVSSTQNTPDAPNGNWNDSNSLLTSANEPNEIFEFVAGLTGAIEPTRWDIHTEYDGGLFIVAKFEVIIQYIFYPHCFPCWICNQFTFNIINCKDSKIWLVYF